MNTERKDLSFGVKFGLALFVAIFCYLMVMTIAGPILVDKIGAAHTSRFPILGWTFFTSYQEWKKIEMSIPLRHPDGPLI